MPTKPLYLIGAGGHARVVLDALLAAGVAPERIRVSDGNPSRAGQLLLGLPVAVPALTPAMADGDFHVAIGDPRARAQLHGELLRLGAAPFTVLHPRSVVSPHAALGAGVFVAAGAVVAPGAVLADGVIVNHGAVVDHDCRVGAFSHVAPGATLGGAVELEPGVLVGAGANLLPGVRVGAHAVIGAGAVVLESVAAGQTRVGVPAVSLTKGTT